MCYFILKVNSLVSDRLPIAFPWLSVKGYFLLYLALLITSSFLLSPDVFDFLLTWYPLLTALAISYACPSFIAFSL